MNEKKAMGLLLNEWLQILEKEELSKKEIFLIKTLLFKDNKLMNNIFTLYTALIDNLRDIEISSENEIHFSWVYRELIKDNKFKNIVDDKEEIKENNKEKEIEYIKQEIYTALILKRRSEATEIMVNYIKKYNYIFSIRDDKAPEIWIYNNGIYINNGETAIKEIVRTIIDKGFSTHLANDVINKIRADTGINAEDFFSKNYVDLIPVNNGLLDISEIKLKPFDPKKIFFNKLPVDFNEKSKCDNIIKFFDDVLNNKEDKDLLQEVIGDCLQTTYKYQRSTMFVGGGNNGKGATFELIKKLFGVKNISSMSLEQIERDQYVTSELFGKLINLAGDIGSKILSDTSRFKELTGGDLVTAQRKFKNPLYFSNYAKLLFSCNELPITRDQSYGFMRRWNYFTFPYTFITKKKYNEINEKERDNFKIEDKEIINKISTPEELSGFLNWILKGLKRLKNNKQWTETKTTKNVKEIWLRKSDSFAAFLMDEIEEDYESFVLKKDLKFKYSQYIKINKVRSCGDKNIKFKLEEFGGYETRKVIEGESLRIYEGIKFKRNGQLGQLGQGKPTLVKFSNIALGRNTLTKSTNPTTAYEGVSQECILDSEKSIPIVKYVLNNQPVDEENLSKIYSDEIIERLITDGVLYRNKPNRISLL